MSSNKHHEADEKEVKLDDDGNWTFNPRGFNIIWGTDGRYWKLPEKGSDGPAELIQVCWLELTGSTKENLKQGTYEINFEVSSTSNNFGWDSSPVYLMAKVGKKGKYRLTKLDLSNLSSGQRSTVPNLNFRIEVANLEDSKLHFGLYEVWTGKWKGGLQIYKAVVKKVL